MTVIDAIETCQKSSQDVQKIGSTIKSAQRAAFLADIPVSRSRKEDTKMLGMFALYCHCSKIQNSLSRSSNP